MTQDRSAIVHFLKTMRMNIIEAFEGLEPRARFQHTEWPHHTGGGGTIGLLRGDVFEKAGVNFSEVWGENYPLDPSKGPFYATGVSLITHMKNPHAPTVHMNLRYIEAKDRWWFGGGYDLTPMGVVYDEDTHHFHQVARKSLDPFGLEIYPQFAQNAKEYFYIPHRKKERGVGGIFFDYMNRENPKADLALWKSVGDHFIDAVVPIYKKRIHMPYGDLEKQIQNNLRAHYVEFNLLYDRGTKFGFSSGGNPEAILCSMPPCAAW